MQLVSITFAAFFGLSATAVWCTPPSWRWAVMLTASAAFVALASPSALAVLVALSAATYVVGQRLEASENSAARRLWLVGGIGAIAGVLVIARLAVLATAGSAFGPPGTIGGALWSLGLSFYGLKAIGYLVDVYHSRIPAERSPGRLAAYLALFIELQAGPIDRAGSLLRQLQATRAFDTAMARDGLRLVLWGCVKKALIGDRFAPFVNLTFADPQSQPDTTLLLAVAAFACQLYFDFSGYTDIAVGLGRIVGLELPENFRQPYFAQSISEFWQRWHATLSSWLRDYCFLPIYYSVSRRLERYCPAPAAADVLSFSVAALATMALAGAWHGFALNYVLWGLWFGVAMALSAATSKARRRLVRHLGLRGAPQFHAVSRWVVTMLVVLIGWTLLRSDSPSDAAWILAVPLRLLGVLAAGPGAAAQSAWGLERVNGLLAFALAAALLLLEWAAVRGCNPGRWLAARPTWFRWSAYYLALAALLFVSRAGTDRFIYAGF